MARASREEAHAKPSLKLGDATADRGLRQPEHARRSSKAGGIDDREKSVDGRELVLTHRKNA